MAYERLGVIVGVLGLWIAAGYCIVELPQYFPTPFNSYLLIVITIVAFVVVGYVLLANPKEEPKTPIQVEAKFPEPKPETARALQLVPGGDELLKELERLEPSCGRIVQSLGVSGQNVNPLIIELSSLRFTLVELAGKYTGQWSVSLDERVTIVANQLGEAGSVLSEKPLDVEHVKAHIDGAVQIARAFITELKSPPQVNTDKKSA
jgi:hypothetical protein